MPLYRYLSSFFKMLVPIQPPPDPDTLKQSVKEAMKKYAEEKSLITGQKDVKILIVAEGRTGSTLLSSFLYSYPGITTFTVYTVVHKCNKKFFFCHRCIRIFWTFARDCSYKEDCGLPAIRSNWSSSLKKHPPKHIQLQIWFWGHEGVFEDEGNDMILLMRVLFPN